ncbi:uncharacterized protein HMPREF1541_04075 [Cyphellophora europaea CBS 101466]|uniref:Uncharacterized protein n=1 Tax=Cyphellophora europaea (strain CBS 101466) TaxID=1220924 RepID=W2S2E4_CYPE1|nr:uncharacterized protein HMPREF1541_04075 [Cyphellophora europaea CBS 101466]ETN42134.1 hypothetical protein HMPREF1541_04075 [Cyphellophora europaea CBS 101466]
MNSTLKAEAVSFHPVSSIQSTLNAEAVPFDPIPKVQSSMKNAATVFVPLPKMKSTLHAEAASFTPTSQSTATVVTNIAKPTFNPEAAAFIPGPYTSIKIDVATSLNDWVFSSDPEAPAFLPAVQAVENPQREQEFDLCGSANPCDSCAIPLPTSNICAEQSFCILNPEADIFAQNRGDTELECSISSFKPEAAAIVPNASNLQSEGFSAGLDLDLDIEAASLTQGASTWAIPSSPPSPAPSTIHPGPEAESAAGNAYIPSPEHEFFGNDGYFPILTPYEFYYYYDAHHLNWLGHPIEEKSFTRPATSLAIIMSKPKLLNRPLEENDNYQLQVLLKSAFRYIDPVVFTGSREILKLGGTKLENAAIGQAQKFYSPCGWWQDDHYGQDEDIPEPDPEDENAYGPEDVVFNGCSNDTDVVMPGQYFLRAHMKFAQEIGEMSVVQKGRREYMREHRGTMIPGSALRNVSNISDLDPFEQPLRDWAYEVEDIDGLGSQNVARELEQIRDGLKIAKPERSFPARVIKSEEESDPQHQAQSVQKVDLKDHELDGHPNGGSGGCAVSNESGVCVLDLVSEETESPSSLEGCLQAEPLTPSKFVDLDAAVVLASTTPIDAGMSAFEPGDEFTELIEDKWFSQDIGTQTRAVFDVGGHATIVSVVEASSNNELTVPNPAEDNDEPASSYEDAVCSSPSPSTASPAEEAWHKGEVTKYATAQRPVSGLWLSTKLNGSSVQGQNEVLVTEPSKTVQKLLPAPSSDCSSTNVICSTSLSDFPLPCGHNLSSTSLPLAPSSLIDPQRLLRRPATLVHTPSTATAMAPSPLILSAQTQSQFDGFSGFHGAALLQLDVSTATAAGSTERQYEYTPTSLQSRHDPTMRLGVVTSGTPEITESPHSDEGESAELSTPTPLASTHNLGIGVRAGHGSQVAALTPHSTPTPAMRALSKIKKRGEQVTKTSTSQDDQRATSPMPVMPSPPVRAPAQLVDSNSAELSFADALNITPPWVAARRADHSRPGQRAPEIPTAAPSTPVRASAQLANNDSPEVSFAEALNITPPQVAARRDARANAANGRASRRDIESSPARGRAARRRYANCLKLRPTTGSVGVTPTTASGIIRRMRDSKPQQEQNDGLITKMWKGFKGVFGKEINVLRY